MAACPRCLGCGQVADSEDAEPWSAWADLPPGSDLAVRMGLVKPVDCPECHGTGTGTVAPAEVNGQTSDGYHTFDELYRFRLLFNAALFNAWNGIAEETCSNYLPVHKSWRHADGEACFGGGWFIVMAKLPTGQISNHYQAKDWDLFQIPEQERADKWDGHTAADVADRIERFLKPGVED